MTSRERERFYEKYKEAFHTYINDIKKQSPIDIYTIINATLIKNPFTSTFPKKFFESNPKQTNQSYLFLKSIAKFYIRNYYLLLSYLISFALFHLIYKTKTTQTLSTIIDVYVLVDNVNNENHFKENYFSGIYDVLEKENIGYTILPRLYQTGKNPFKLIQFFKIINRDQRDFLFEFELLKIRHFFTLLQLITLYPFKTLRILQTGNTQTDRIFNQSLLEDIALFNFESLTRYIFGQNIAKLEGIQTIYSWSEFQVNERSFNYAIRTNNEIIKIIACQFFLNYETYFNTHVDDIDYDHKSSSHVVLVNGIHYVLNRKKVIYQEGVALRYGQLFKFNGIQKEENILLLGSYLEEETKYLLESASEFEAVLFKNHPAVNIKKLGRLSENITVTDENIYKLFENAKIVVGTASGSLIEAAGSGLSVIIIASRDNLTANPFVTYGKGKIWDIAYTKDEVKDVYNKLLFYRNQHRSEILEIAKWYRDNFFICPIEENIIKLFKLK